MSHAMGKIRCAIVDDERIARQIVRRLLEADPELEVIAEGDGASLASTLATLAPDLIFLDIEMPEVDGFDLLAQLGELEPVVVFVTAYHHYALRAFEAHALDYLVKPFSDQRFAAALAHAKKRWREQGGFGREAAATLRAAITAPAEQPVERFLVPVGSKWQIVPVAELEWIEAADYYARLHAGSRSWLLRESLAELAKKLDPRRFFRVHRSAIVRIDQVAEVHSHFRGDFLVVLKNGRQLPLSRTRRAAFEAWLLGV